jgi:hypothetical protein
MFPYTFLAYLRQYYTKKENIPVFEEVIKVCSLLFMSLTITYRTIFMGEWIQYKIFSIIRLHRTFKRWQDFKKK